MVGNVVLKLTEINFLSVIEFNYKRGIERFKCNRYRFIVKNKEELYENEKRRTIKD